MTLALVINSVGMASCLAAKQSKSGSGAKSSLRDDPGCASCLSRAASLFASNQLDGAAELLRQWSAKCPKNTQLHLLLSTILIRQSAKNAPEAEKEAEMACFAQPDNQGAHLQYAMLLQSQEKFSAAAEEFEQVTYLNPGSYEAWTALGDVYKRLRRDEEAKSALEKASFLEPGSLAIKLSVLKNLKKAGKLGSAKRELKNLIQSSQSIAEFQQSLASEALQIGAFDEALEAANNVLKSYPDSKGPLKIRFLAEFLKGSYEPALATADKLISRDEKSGELFALRGICKLKRGLADEASQDIGKSANLDPHAGFVMLADGMLKLNAGDFESAAEKLKSAADSQIVPGQTERIAQSLAHLALARLNLKEGLIADASQEACSAASDKRFEAAALALEARCQLADTAGKESLAKAVKLIEKAQSLDSNEPELLLARAFYQLKSGNLQEAKRQSARAIELSPGNSDSYLLAAQIAEKEKNVSEQKSKLEEGLKIAKNDPELLYALARIYLQENKAEQALPLLKEAAFRRVRAAEICFALAEACEKTGAAAESVKYYKQSLAQGLSGEETEQARAAISRLETNK